ncbi:MAG: protein translocase subunit SecD [Pseudomonadales bacterium]|nr:protein translocase subunit SecD [Candidatus Woesebacteria bacterium]MCB9802232.1 protein translocase subunit SecD [Pseudomonadales bacterium]
MSGLTKKLIEIVLLAIVSTIIALPSTPTQIVLMGRQYTLPITSPTISFMLGDRLVHKTFELKKGLDIQGGMQILLDADMSGVSAADRADALETVRAIITRRVDLYGISEPNVQTSVSTDAYRVLVELPGVEDPAEALSLVGTTAQLSFALLDTQAAQTVTDASTSASLLQPTDLDGSQLQKSTVQFQPDTGEPVVGISFNSEGTELFSQITTDHTGQALAIVLDGVSIMAPVIREPIVNGQAVISGGMTVEQAKELSIQLNAGALPVPVSILEQRSIGASLGAASIKQSTVAGLIGLVAVVVFMISMYGTKGAIVSLALALYGVMTIAVYKVLGVTLTLPGIAGLLLSVGMAVDANILIFERMKEELRSGKSGNQALELGFGRAWDSIKDANVATILTSLILINPLNVSFLSTSGIVRGFGITLLIGVLLGLFTGVFISRVLLRAFLRTDNLGEERL